MKSNHIQHLYWRVGFGILPNELEKFSKKSKKKIVDGIIEVSQKVTPLKVDTAELDDLLNDTYEKTKENINNRGFIARPSDQRIKFGILFQDYVPNLPDLKAYLNLVYNSGVPGGAPSYSDPYNFQQRLRDYRRADLGISYVFAVKKWNINPRKILKILD